MTLNECNALFRVNSARKQKCIGLYRVLSELDGVLLYRYCVKVNYRIDAVVFVLQRPPVSDSPDIVSEGECSRRLNSAEYYLLVGSRSDFSV